MTAGDAPQPPSDGSRPPVENGWPLGSYKGRLPWGWVHGKETRRQIIGLVTAVAVLGGTGLGLFAWMMLLGRYSGSWVLLVLFVATALCCVAPAVLLWLSDRLTFRGVRAYSVDAPRDGTLVRVSGRVVSERPFLTALTRIPAVMARYRARLTYGGLLDVDHTRGIDFDLETDGLDRLRIAVSGSFLADKPHGSYHEPEMTDIDPALLGVAQARPFVETVLDRYDPVFSEVALAPGDRVEVVGFLFREVDPRADETAPGRGNRIGGVLRSSDKLALIVGRSFPERISDPAERGRALTPTLARVVGEGD